LGYDRDQSSDLAARQISVTLLNLYGYDEAMQFLQQYQSQLSQEWGQSIREICPDSL
jgi:hypothetical protein